MIMIAVKCCGEVELTQTDLPNYVLAVFTTSWNSSGDSRQSLQSSYSLSGHRRSEAEGFVPSGDIDQHGVCCKKQKKEIKIPNNQY